MQNYQKQQKGLREEIIILFLSLKKMALTKSFKSLYVSHSRILCLLFRVDYVKTACNNLKLRNFIDS